VFILPYIEQAPLFQQYSASINNYMTSGGSDQSWRGLAVNRIPVMSCPIDPSSSNMCTLNTGANSGLARGNYAANARISWFNYTVNGASSSGPQGFNASNQGGPFGINWGGRLAADISDGTSNVIMFNEVRVGLNASDRRGCWAMGLPGASVTAAHAVGDATN